MDGELGLAAMLAAGKGTKRDEWSSNQAAGSENLGIAAAAWHVIAITVASASSLVAHGDGLQTASVEPHDAVTTNTFILLSWNGVGAVCDMDLAECIIYDSALSDANRARVEAYLKTKWGTP